MRRFGMDPVPRSVQNPETLYLNTVKKPFRFNAGTEFLSQPLDCHSLKKDVSADNMRGKNI